MFIHIDNVLDLIHPDNYSLLSPFDSYWSLFFSQLCPGCSEVYCFYRVNYIRDFCSKVDRLLGAMALYHYNSTEKKKSLPLPQLPLTTYKSSKKYGSSGTFQTIWQAACRLIGKSCADNPTFLEWKWCVFCRTCVFIVLCSLFGFVCLYFF